MTENSMGIKPSGCFQQDILFSTGVLLEDKIFAISSGDYIPITIDLHSGEVSLINDLKGYLLFGSDEMMNDKDNIYVLELNGKRLMHFNVYEKICHYYEIDCHKEEWGNFVAFVKWGKNLLIFPRFYNKIVIFDCSTRTIAVKKGMDVKRWKEIGSEQKKVYFRCGCQSGGMVWFITEDGGFLVKYDIKFDRWKRYRLSVEVKNCVHMMDFGNMLYLLNAEGRIYCWDKIEHSIGMIAQCGKNSENEFGGIAVTDRNIVVLPYMGKDIYVISRDTGLAELYSDYPANFQYCGPEGWSKYYGYCENKDYYFFAMRTAAYVLCINKRNGSVQWIKAIPPLREEYAGGYLRYKGIVGEVEISLEDMLRALSIVRVRGGQYSCATTGKQIWNVMIER